MEDVQLLEAIAKHIESESGLRLNLTQVIHHVIKAYNLGR
jgi:hypothetical protein